MRGNTLVLKQQTFIESARSIGASDATILFNHILPGRCHRSWFISPCALGYRLFRRPVCRFSASARSRPPGVGRDAQRSAGGYGDVSARGALPAVAIFVTVLAFNLLGDGLRDALDPKLKG